MVEPPAALAREELIEALRAQRRFFGADADAEAEATARALAWLRAVWESGMDSVPFLLVHDLGHLLLRGRDLRFASSRHLGSWPEEERVLRLAYEDKLLGAWAQQSGIRDVHVAVAGMPVADMDRAIAHAIGLALGRELRRLHGPSGNPAHLRTLSPEAILPAPGDDSWLAWTADHVHDWIDALRNRELFGEEDLWEIAHLPELPSESARLALRELHTALHKIGPLSASALSSLRRSTREVAIDETDADAYPTGGFDAIATQGSLENLVRSEVAYVGEGRLADSGIDLFDVRFFEGELLYYTRDDNPLFDAVRTLNLVVDRPAELRHKHARLPAQNLVLVQALCAMLQADLVRTFGPAGSRVRLAWRVSTSEDFGAASEECSLLAITLKAEVAHLRASLDVVEDLDDVAAAGRIVFSPRRSPDDFTGAWVRADGDVWQHAGESTDAADYRALRDLGTRLLLEHLG